MRNKILTAAVFAGCVGSTTALAIDVGANTTVGGQAFLDFSHITQQQNGVDVAPTGTGFDAKRFYLSADHKFDDVWAADITLDAQYVGNAATNANGYSNSTSASSGGVTEVFIKKLYLQAKLDDAFVVHAGSYTSPWAPFVESLYGYRYIEKTQTDRLGFANTADWGLNATGKFGDSLVTYSASVVDGGGYKNPTRTKEPDYELRVGVQPVKWLTVGAGFYSGHLGQVTQTNSGNPNHTATRWDLAAGVNVVGLRVGAEYFNAKDYKSASAATGVYGTSAVVAGGGLASATVPPSDKADGFSSWASYAFTDSWAVFGRYDQAKLSKDVVSGLKDTYFNVGVAYKPAKPLDLALVYKNEKVDDGTVSVSGGDANASYTIGSSGINGNGTPTTGGKFEEIGFYAQYTF